MTGYEVARLALSVGFLALAVSARLRWLRRRRP